MTREYSTVAKNFDEQHWPGDNASDDELQNMIEEVREQYSDDELGKLARGGSDAAQRALVDSMREKRGREEALDIMHKHHVWQEEPEKAISMLRQKDSQFEEADITEEAEYSRKEPIDILIENSEAEILEEYAKLVDIPDEEVNEKVKDHYQDLLDSSDVLDTLEAARMADRFGGQEAARKAAKQVLDHYGVSEDAEYGTEKVTNSGTAEKVAEAAEMVGSREADKAIRNGYQESVEEGDYFTAAQIAKATKNHSVGVGRKEELQAAKKRVEEKVDDGNYDKAIEIAHEHQLGGEYMQDVLTKAVVNDEIDEDEYQNHAEEIEGYQAPDEVSAERSSMEGSGSGYIEKLKSLI